MTTERKQHLRSEIAQSGWMTVMPREQRASSNLSDWGALWQADAADANARDRSKLTSPAGLLQLVSWPPLTELPASLVPLAARICALLACRPSVAMMVPLLLGEPEEQVYPMLETLHAFGYLAASQAAPVASVRSDALVEAESAAPSWIGKLWRRLAGQA